MFANLPHRDPSEQGRRRRYPRSGVHSDPCRGNLSRQSIAQGEALA